MVTLRFQPADGKPFERELTERPLIVGRSSSADVALADPLLSRQHVRIQLCDGGVEVEDLGSRNGTFVAGQRLQGPHRLGSGECLNIGGSVVEVPGASAPRLTVRGENDFLSSSGTILKRADEFLESQTSVPSGGEERGLQRQAERLRLLNEVHQALSASAERQELIELILDRLFEQLKPEQAAVLLKGADGAVQPVASRSGRGPDTEIVLSRNLIHEVVEKGMAALVLDTETDERFAGAESLMISGVRSLVAAPLLDREGNLGMVVLFSRVANRAFTEEDLELLVSLASVAALKLRNVALQDEAIERRRLQKELALARRIQEGLLPDRLPSLTGWQLHASNHPSRFVSGDYYHVRTRCDGRQLVIFVADVSGKGIAAALLTASLDALAEAPIEDGMAPEEICARMSRGIHRRTTPEKYATAFLAVVDLETGGFRWANAGHNPALLVSGPDRIERLESSGFPIGMIEPATWEATDSVLEPGQALVIYTDGLTEAENLDDEELGLKRFEGIVGAVAGAAPDEMAEEIGQKIAAWVGSRPFGDDRTLVILRRQN